MRKMQVVYTNDLRTGQVMENAKDTAPVALGATRKSADYRLVSFPLHASGNRDREQIIFLDGLRQPMFCHSQNMASVFEAWTCLYTLLEFANCRLVGLCLHV